jgi:pimeloyl-ACP methyl ester carboxylesterase
LAELFPPDQRAAAGAFEMSLAAWPASPTAHASVVAAEERAITAGWSGVDPAGRRTRRISAPMLVTDGTIDRLDPQENAHRLAQLINGAAVSLYPDAGHAFLFQEETAVVARIESFLTR